MELGLARPIMPAGRRSGYSTKYPMTSRIAFTVPVGGHPRIGDAILAAQATDSSFGAFPELLSVYQLLADPALHGSPVGELRGGHVFHGQTKRLEDGDLAIASPPGRSGNQLPELGDDVIRPETSFLNPEHDVARFDERGAARVHEQSRPGDERRIHLALSRPAGADRDDMRARLDPAVLEDRHRGGRDQDDDVRADHGFARVIHRADVRRGQTRVRPR